MPSVLGLFDGFGKAGWRDIVLLFGLKFKGLVADCFEARTEVAQCKYGMV